jgi:hypothetical protein
VRLIALSGHGLHRAVVWAAESLIVLLGVRAEHAEEFLSGPVRKGQGYRDRRPGIAQQGCLFMDGPSDPDECVIVEKIRMAGRHVGEVNGVREDGRHDCGQSAVGRRTSDGTADGGLVPARPHHSQAQVIRSERLAIANRRIVEIPRPYRTGNRPRGAVNRLLVVDLAVEVVGTGDKPGRR